jgi:sulfur carrier protein
MAASITVFINGKTKILNSPCTLQQALDQWGYKEGPFAVAINHRVIQRDSYIIEMLQQGDEIDLLYPMQGG